MEPMSRASGGKRAGARRATTNGRSTPTNTLVIGGVVLALAAWAYLVYAAVSFGSDARNGTGHDWILLALAAVGAMACLFTCLMLVARLARALGFSSPGRAAAGRRAGKRRRAH